jgi:2-octaprenyl-6-methoxyphenol hydroxylase
MSKTHEFDLILVGAGLVGTSLISALLESDLRIAVLESHLLDLSQAPSAASRPISLSYGSQQLLTQLGIWSKLEAHATTIKQVHVSSQNQFGRSLFNCNDYDLPALGYVLPFDHLRHALYQHAMQHPKLTVYSSEQLLNITKQQEHITVTYQGSNGKTQLSAKALIATDGTQSQSRELLGIHCERTDHHEHALTATLQLNRSLDTAYERFSPDGVVAILPRKNQQAGMVWTLTPDLKAQFDLLSSDEICQRLQTIMGQRIGKILNLKKNACYPLITCLAKESHVGRACLLGNAAHSFYPIAAQGFNLSLRDVRVMARLLKAPGALENPESLFAHYQHLRAKDQAATLQLINQTRCSFDLNLPGLNQIRGLALCGLDAIAPLKHRIARRTLGTEEPLWS